MCTPLTSESLIICHRAYRNMRVGTYGIRPRRTGAKRDRAFAADIFAMLGVRIPQQEESSDYRQKAKLVFTSRCGIRVRQQYV